MKTFTQEEAIAFLKRQQGKRSMGEFADWLGVSIQLLSGVYHKKWLPGKTLGFKKIKESVRFQRIEAADGSN